MAVFSKLIYKFDMILADSKIPIAPYLTSCMKINKVVQIPNMAMKTMKLGRIWVNLNDLEFGKGFLDKAPKT